MTGRAKCEPGCTCGRHGRVPVIDWNDPVARKAYNRAKANERYATDPVYAEGRREYARQRTAANPGRHGRMRDRPAEMKWRYGLSAGRIAQMAVEQQGMCFLCGEPLNFEKKHAVHVDHDHACCRGARSCGTCVRGLACSKCNAGIGHFGDDPERMRRVADNLEMAMRAATARMAGSPVQGDLFDEARPVRVPSGLGWPR
jgi:Recombination endonuclease VII